jgi:hypothetical protein
MIAVNNGCSDPQGGNKARISEIELVVAFVL